MLRPSRFSAALVLGTALMAASDVGCSAGTEDDAAGAGASDSTSSFGQGGSTGAFGTGGGVGIGGGCVGTGNTAQKVPLDIYIMLDKSGSMDGAKWDSATAAIASFVGQMEASGIGVGIQYFPIPSGVTCPDFPVQCTNDSQCSTGCGPCFTSFPGQPGFCSGVGTADSCERMDYATPAVEIAVLPGNATNITTSMSGENADGSGTPTSAALQGAIDHASAWSIAHPGHVTIVVLATDGDPTSCDDDLAVINGIAQAGANATPKVLTFVIGVGGSQTNLDGIAAAGGTGAAYMVDASPNVQTAFLTALNAIQEQSLPCSYLIPPPPPGETIDFTQVNVSYTPGNGGDPQTIPQATGLGDCMSGSLAWYYDNPSSPTQIVLCPDACSTLTADTDGTVKVVLDCATVVQ